MPRLAGPGLGLVLLSPDEFPVGNEADAGRRRQDRSSDRAVAVDRARVRRHRHRSRRRRAGTATCPWRARHSMSTSPTRSHLPRYVDGQDMVMSAAPFHATSIIATAARNAGAHYFDLTEDVDSTRVVKSLAVDATSALVPQCGLAPGFVSIAAAELAQIVRRHPLDLDARRRAATVPDQRVQVQPHLVDRRTDQRVLQSVRGDRRRQDARGASARRGRGLLARRRRLRGVQHLRRAGHAVRDAARRGRDAQLQDRPLSGSPRRDQDADHRPATVAATRPVEGVARGRRSRSPIKTSC